MDTKQRLAFAFRILAHLGLDDHTYTHLSARSKHGFYLPAFGYRFEEITKDLLIEVDHNGKPLDPTSSLNITGQIIHQSIYKKRPDICAVFHLHTPAMIAVSAMEKGLLPLSQWALHFYEQVNYHDYGALALEGDQGEGIANDLGDKRVLMLRNHGVIVCGRTLHEALFYAYHLERACQTQCLALSSPKPLIIPDHAVCVQSCHELLSFEKDLGLRDWLAWERVLVP